VSIPSIASNVFVMDFTSVTINTNALQFWEVINNTCDLLCLPGFSPFLRFDLFELCVHQVFILFLKTEPVSTLYPLGHFSLLKIGLLELTVILLRFDMLELTLILPLSSKVMR
jgi:hypothetical protein